MSFIDAYRHRFDFDPVLRGAHRARRQIAPSTYYAFTKRAPSACALRDAQLALLIARVYEANYSAYVAAKMWDHLNRVAGVVVADCTVEPLMSKMGLVGTRRGKEPVTTTPPVGSDTPGDLVNRHFGVDAPNRLRLADLSRVRTGCGWVYLAFVIDTYSRRVLRWRASHTPHTKLALDASDHGHRHTPSRRPQNRPSGSPQRPRIAIPVHPLQHQTRRQQHHRRLGRLSGRQLRQRHDLKLQRPIQIRTHLPPRTLAKPTRSRVRHPRIRRLVQPPTQPQPTPRWPIHHPHRTQNTHYNQNPTTNQQTHTKPSLYQTRCDSSLWRSPLCQGPVAAQR